jgi:hypothetical protein
MKDTLDYKLPVEESMAGAVWAKVINDSMNAEINLVKAALMCKKEGVEVGRVNKMGQNVIIYDDERMIEIPEDEDE